jgi:hypothetical protein
MKTSTLFLTFLSAADIAAAAKFVVGPPGWAQSIGINVTESEDYKQLVARQAKGGGGGTGTKVVLKNRTPHIANSKSVKIRYGPFTVNGGGPYVLCLQISHIATLISHVFIFSTSFLAP